MKHRLLQNKRGRKNNRVRQHLTTKSRVKLGLMRSPSFYTCDNIPQLTLLSEGLKFSLILQIFGLRKSPSSCTLFKSATREKLILFIHLVIIVCITKALWQKFPPWVYFGVTGKLQSTCLPRLHASASPSESLG